MGVTGPRLQSTLFEKSRPGRGGGKIPHPPKGRPRPAAGRGPPGQPARPARAQRARGRPPLRQPEPAELRDRHRLLPARLVHDEVQPQAQRMGRPPARLRRSPPARPGRDRPGHPPAPVGARGDPGRDQRHAGGQPPAGRRGPGRADRHPDDPGLPPQPGRPRAARGPRPGFLARHQPGHGLDGRLQDDHDPVGRRWRRRPRRVPGGPRAADGGRDDHQPIDPRPVRDPDRRAARGGPRRRRPGLHGRREPERDPGPVQAGRGRLRRDAHQHPQDVQHAPRRRRAGRRAGRRRSTTSCRSCPPRVLREDDGSFRLERPGERPTSIGRLRSFVGQYRRPGPRLRLSPGARRATVCARSARTRCSPPTT